MKNFTLLEAAEALEKKEISSVELTRSLIERIDTVEDKVNAFVSVDRDSALTSAAKSDQRRASGETIGKYDGIPITVKDNLAVEGQPNTCASKILEGFTSPYDASVIKKLRDQGFIFLGRANMDEFAMGSSTEHSAFKPTSNPWSLDCVPGGSSGGSAAAVAAGETIAALGSDTGGSIRQPAGFCGVVGLKPTYGRVSRYGLVAFASSLDQIGPLTKTVSDSAALLDIISGLDPNDSTSLPNPVESYTDSLKNLDIKGMKIGLPKEYFEVKGLDPEVKKSVEKAANAYKEMGAELVEVSLPHTEYAVAAYYIVATAEASSNLSRYEGIRYGARDKQAEMEDLLSVYRKTRENGFGEEVKRRIILGTYVLSSGYYDAYYLKAMKVRTLIRRDFENAFKQCDIILSPVSPAPAFKRGAITDPLQMYLSDIYTISANLAGIPGISLPCGLNSAGLPIGLQLLGPALGETPLLRAAAAYEQQNPFVCPPLHGG